MNRTLFYILTLSLALIINGSSASAQDSEAKFGSELSAHVGTWLPNQIPGITEIMPGWGARYSLSLGTPMLEIGYRNHHAKGVDFNVASLDLRYDMNMIDSFTNVFYIGYDLNGYTPLGESERKWKGGTHVGTAFLMHVVSTFWLRMDMSFAVSPGTSLYLGFGFALRAPEGGGGE